MKKIFLVLVVVIIVGSFSYLIFPVKINHESNSNNQSSNKDQPTKNVVGKSLDVSGQNLTRLTAEFFNDNTNTVTLDVSNNKLTGALPAEIRKMTGLKIVRANNNQLTGIPAEIGQLNQLQELDFSYNQINTYPNEMANLKNNLKILKLTGNTFTTEQINTLKQLLPKTNIEF